MPHPGHALLMAKAAAAPSAPTPDHFWIDASVTSSITTASDGGTNRITAWNDQTANNLHLSGPATAGDRPIYHSGTSPTQNGIMVPRFQAGDWLFRNATVLGTNRTHQTIFLVIGNVATSASAFVGGDGSSLSSTQVWHMRMCGDGRSVAYLIRNDGNTTLAGNGGDTAVDLPSSGFAIYTLVDNGSSLKGYINGVAPSNANNPLSYTPSGTFTLDRFAIGGLYRAGSIGNLMSGFDLAEMRIYTTALSDSDRGAVETALTSKWGI